MQIRLEDFTESVDPLVATEENAFKAKLAGLLTTQAKLDIQLSEERAESARGFFAVDPEILRKSRAVAVEISQLTYKLAGKRSERGAASLVVPRSSSQLTDPYSVEVLSVPTDMALEINSFRLADTLKASMPYRDAPFDNQIIRAALVEVFMGEVPAAQFASPESWQLPIDQSTLVFRGFVDSWDDSHGEDDTVSFSARSMESVLIDTKVQPAGIPKAGKPGEKITTWIDKFFQTIPAVSGGVGGVALHAVLDPNMDPAEEPIIDRALVNRALQTAKSQNAATQSLPGQPPIPDQAPVTPGATTPGSEEGTGDARVPVASTSAGETTAWDVVVAVCELGGGLLPTYDPTINANAIVLRQPQTTFSDVSDGVNFPGSPLGDDTQVGDGFSRALKDADGDTFRTAVRFFVWGNNIKTIKKSRKLGRIKSPTVEVICNVEGASPKERTIRARFPPTNSKRATRVGENGAGKQEEVVVRVVKGIRNKAQLEQVAASLYHQMSRQETVVTIETDDTSSYIDHSTTPYPENKNDLFRIRSGTPVRVLVASQSTDVSQGLVVNQLSEIWGKRGDALRDFLERQIDRFIDVLGFEDIARMRRTYSAISTAFESARLSDVFYCRSARHQWNIEDGWAGTFELVNYMRVRGDPASMTAEAQAINNVRKKHKPGKGKKKPLREDTKKVVENAEKATTAE
jgi:hypothetical protein